MPPTMVYIPIRMCLASTMIYAHFGTCLTLVMVYIPIKMHLALYVPIRIYVMVYILVKMHLAHNNIFNVSFETQTKIHYVF